MSILFIESRNLCLPKKLFKKFENLLADLVAKHSIGNLVSHIYNEYFRCFHWHQPPSTSSHSTWYFIGTKGSNYKKMIRRSRCPEGDQPSPEEWSSPHQPEVRADEGHEYDKLGSPYCDDAHTSVVFDVIGSSSLCTRRRSRTIRPRTTPKASLQVGKSTGSFRDSLASVAASHVPERDIFSSGDICWPHLNWTAARSN